MIQEFKNNQLNKSSRHMIIKEQLQKSQEKEKKCKNLLLNNNDTVTFDRTRICKINQANKNTNQYNQ